MPSVDFIVEELGTAAGLLKAGRLDDAQKIYHDILGADPRQSDALNGMARIAFAHARPGTALMLLGRMAEVSAPSPIDQYLAAYTHLLSGQPDKAKSLLLTLRKLQPTNAELLCNLGSACRQLGESSEAEALYREASKIDPDQAQSVVGLGWLAYDQRQFKTARRALTKASTLPKPHPDMALLEACIRDEEGTITEVSNDIFKAYQQAPQDPLCTVLLAAVMVAQGNELEAERTVQDLLLNFPDLVPAHLLKARINLLRGNRDQAKQDAERVLALAPWSYQACAMAEAVIAQAAQTPRHAPKSIVPDAPAPASDLSRDMLESALSNTPDDVAIQLRLVECLTEERELIEAADLVQQVIASHRQNGWAHHLLAVILTRTGQWAEALEFAEKAIALIPDRAEAWAQLADIQIRQEKFMEADKTARQALKLDPLSAYANHLQARAKAKLERFDEAERQYQKVLSLDPDYADSLAGLTTLYYEQDRLEGALEMSVETLRLEPDRHQILSVVGQIHEQLGDLERGAASHEDAIRAKPDFAEGYFQLSNLHRFSSDDPMVTEMERIRSLETLDRTNRYNISFALANAYHRQSRYSEAFSLYVEGNHLLAEGSGYDPDDIQKRVEAIKRTFTQTYLENAYLKGTPDPTPVFILGMPRSGTTLCEQILSSHRDVYGAGELVQMSGFAVNEMQKISLGRYPEWIDYLTQDQISTFANSFISGIRKLSPDTRHITDKTPGNFMYIGLIRLAFPNAKIIHCHRDPMDNCLSMFRTAFAGRHYYSCDLEHLGHYYNSYVEVMDHWNSVLPGRLYDWHYETAVNDVETATRKLLDFLDLEWDENCLDFHRSKRRVNTASVTQVRQPIYTSSVGGWQNYSAELAPLRQILESGAP